MDELILSIAAQLRLAGRPLRSDELAAIIRAHNAGIRDVSQHFSKKRLYPAFLRAREDDPDHWRARGIDETVERLLVQTLQMKPRRTASGVATITVITKPWKCGNACLYCPNDIRMPKSYLADEPACQRAERNFFDPFLQVASRMKALVEMGHPTDKVELIVLGGTWCDYPETYQVWYITRLFQALNEGAGAQSQAAQLRSAYKERGFANSNRALSEQTAAVQQRIDRGELSYNEAWDEVYGASELWNELARTQCAGFDELEAAQHENETAAHRVVGLVVETRPATLSPERLLLLRRLGCTKLQMGVQTLQPDVLALNRRCSERETAASPLPRVTREADGAQPRCRGWRRMGVSGFHARNPRRRQDPRSRELKPQSADKIPRAREALSRRAGEGGGCGHDTADRGWRMDRSPVTAGGQCAVSGPFSDFGPETAHGTGPAEPQMDTFAIPRIHGDEVERAFALARLFGFKIHAHFMVNLPGSTPEADLQDYRRFVTEPAWLPDEVKLYPTVMVAGTGLTELHARGGWIPYSEEELTAVLAEDVFATPPFMRISRMIRDISASDIVAGNKKTNLRQMVERRVADEHAASGRQVQEIRFRELGTQEANIGELVLIETPYGTSSADEWFLQWVTPENRIAGFLRLSIPNAAGRALLAGLGDGNALGSALPIGANEAMIREVHVYGHAARLHRTSQGAQHQGLGRQLIERACEIARERGCAAVNVISSVGTREYYRAQGFRDNGLYQQRSLA